MSAAICAARFNGHGTTYLDSAGDMLAGSPWTAIGAGGRER